MGTWIIEQREKPDPDETAQVTLTVGDTTYVVGWVGVIDIDTGVKCPDEVVRTAAAMAVHGWLDWFVAGKATVVPNSPESIKER